MSGFHLRLPATSANLGPGFDTAAVALSLFLDVMADIADEMSIVATGRNSAQISKLEQNLILETYRDLAPAAPALQLVLGNDIPLGMGCGSSAAALLAGVCLANHFGNLYLSPQQILEEACVREGHPDNVAACFYGGFTVSAMTGRNVTAATFGIDLPWRFLLAIPAASLSTITARALLPTTYARSDAVENLQSLALLVSAFAQGRPELLLAGTRDVMHQPYRSTACPLLPRLLPLAGTRGIHSVTLSGAGPAVLLIADPKADVSLLTLDVREASQEMDAEVIDCRMVPDTLGVSSQLR